MALPFYLKIRDLMRLARARQATSTFPEILFSGFSLRIQHFKPKSSILGLKIEAISKGKDLHPLCLL
jgi:hypothetical protein